LWPAQPFVVKVSVVTDVNYRRLREVTAPKPGEVEFDMRRSYAIAVGLALAMTPVMAPLVADAGLATAVPSPFPSGNGQNIQIVIQRALSQRGVPYVYGGGNASGPTNGVRQSGATAPGTGTVPGLTATAPGTGILPGLTATAPGTGTIPGTTVGFDASGLIQYAFAGAGIKMPRTSGQQCNVGRKVPPAQARPGDLMCYGPGGTQSVAMYLGNGQMVEATEPAVTVSPARTNGMTPYLTRIIDS
jgi:cell wall-associated NlpC family hydrolase